LSSPYYLPPVVASMHAHDESTFYNNPPGGMQAVSPRIPRHFTLCSSTGYRRQLNAAGMKPT